MAKANTTGIEYLFRDYLETLDKITSTNQVLRRKTEDLVKLTDVPTQVFKLAEAEKISDTVDEIQRLKEELREATASSVDLSKQLVNKLKHIGYRSVLIPGSSGTREGLWKVQVVNGVIKFEAHTSIT